MRSVAAPWWAQPTEWAAPSTDWPAGALVLPIDCPLSGGTYTVQPWGTAANAAVGPAANVPGYVGMDFASPVQVTGNFTWVVVACAEYVSTANATGFSLERTGALGTLELSVAAGQARFVVDNNPGTVMTGDFTVPTVFVVTRVANQIRSYAAGEFKGTAVTGTRTGAITGANFGRARTALNNPGRTIGEMQAVYPVALSDDDIRVLATNPWVLYAPRQIQVPTSAGEAPAPESIQPPLLTNVQTFYGPSVGRGAVALSAPLLSSIGLLYAASVGRGSIALSPPLLSNTQTLFAPVVTSVSAALRPPLLTNTSTVYAPEVKRGAVTLAAPLLVNPSQMFAPAVGSGTVSIGVPLLANASVAHAPSVQAGAVALSAPLLASAGEVYAPSVSAGEVQVLPPLLASTQIFYAPSVTGGAAAIRPGLLANTSDLYAPAVTVGDVLIAPPLLVGVQIFYPAIVGRPKAEEAYPLAGRTQVFPLVGQQQTYPLAGATQE